MTEFYRFLGKRGHITIPHQIRRDFDMRDGDIFHVIPLPEENRIVLQRAEINDFCPMQSKRDPLNSLYRKIDRLDDVKSAETVLYLVCSSARETLRSRYRRDRQLISVFNQIDKLNNEQRVELLVYLFDRTESDADE